MWAVKKNMKGKKEENKSQIDSRPAGDFRSPEILVLKNFVNITFFFFFFWQTFPTNQLHCSSAKQAADILSTFTLVWC